MSVDAGIFDYPAIKQSCWQTCDADAGRFPIDMDEVPVYRDSDTRKAFYDLAVHFGCVDLCEHDYEIKRIALIVPLVACALGFLLVCIVCAACPGCPLNRVCCKRKKNRDFVSSEPPAVQPQMTWAMPPAESPEPGPAAHMHQRSTISKKSASAPPAPAAYECAKRYDIEQDVPHSANGRIMVHPSPATNAWVGNVGAGGPSAGESNQNSRSLIGTASKFGRKLFAGGRGGGKSENRVRSLTQRF